MHTKVIFIVHTLLNSLKSCKYIYISSSYERSSPWTVKDGIEFGRALEMIRASQLTGKNGLSYQKTDTICKIRKLYSNLYESSSRDSYQMIAFRDPKGDSIFLSNCPVQSRLFTRFSKGLLEMIGR